jgi:hypothetical protein
MSISVEYLDYLKRVLTRLEAKDYSLISKMPHFTPMLHLLEVLYYDPYAFYSEGIKISYQANLATGNTLTHYLVKGSTISTPLMDAMSVLYHNIPSPLLERLELPQVTSHVSPQIDPFLVALPDSPIKVASSASNIIPVSDFDSELLKRLTALRTNELTFPDKDLTISPVKFTNSERIEMLYLRT